MNSKKSGYSKRHAADQILIYEVKYMLNSKKSSNSKQLSADRAFYYIHVTLYHQKK